MRYRVVLLDPESEQYASASAKFVPAGGGAPVDATVVRVHEGEHAFVGFEVNPNSNPNPSRRTRTLTRTLTRARARARALTRSPTLALSRSPSSSRRAAPSC